MSNEIKEMSQILQNLSLEKNVTEDSLTRMRERDETRFESVKKITSKLLPKYAENKRVRNVYKSLDTKKGSIVPLIKQFDLRVVKESSDSDLRQRVSLEKYATEKEKSMVDDILRFTLFQENRIKSLITDPLDPAPVSRAFLMDVKRGRCYPLASKDAKNMIGPIVLVKALPSERGKLKHSLEEEAQMIEGYYNELSLLLEDEPIKKEKKRDKKDDKKEKKKMKKEKKEKKREEKKKKREDVVVVKEEEERITKKPKLEIESMIIEEKKVVVVEEEVMEDKHIITKPTKRERQISGFQWWDNRVNERNLS